MTPAKRQNFERLLNPRHIAFVGGRDAITAITEARRRGFAGQMWAVNPTRADESQNMQDSPGPGKWRGGAGVIKGSTLLEAENTVMSYICDRERAVVWGVEGGLPSMPHGLMVEHVDTGEEEWLGSVFSNYKIKSGDKFTRPTAGGAASDPGGGRTPPRALPRVPGDFLCDGEA
mgnify:CR=1 FL=1